MAAYQPGTICANSYWTAINTFWVIKVVSGSPGGTTPQWFYYWGSTPASIKRKKHSATTWPEHRRQIIGEDFWIEPFRHIIIPVQRRSTESLIIMPPYYHASLFFEPLNPLRLSIFGFWPDARWRTLNPNINPDKESLKQLPTSFPFFSPSFRPRLSHPTWLFFVFKR